MPVSDAQCTVYFQSGKVVRWRWFLFFVFFCFLAADDAEADRVCCVTSRLHTHIHTPQVYVAVLSPHYPVRVNNRDITTVTELVDGDVIEVGTRLLLVTVTPEGDDSADANNVGATVASRNNNNVAGAATNNAADKKLARSTAERDGKQPPKYANGAGGNAATTMGAASAAATTTTTMTTKKPTTLAAGAKLAYERMDAQQRAAVTAGSSSASASSVSSLPQSPSPALRHRPLPDSPC